MTGAGHASDPQLETATNLGRTHVTTNDHIGHGEPSTRFQNAQPLPQDGILIDRKIDHAVRDDNVHRSVGQRNHKLPCRIIASGN
jgi:hypothetical protein